MIRARTPGQLLATVLASTLTLVMAVVMAVVLTQAPADAAIQSRRDAVGDAPARIDLTRVTANNGDFRIRMTIDVRNLRKAGRFFFEYYAFDQPGSDYGFEGGEVHVRRLLDGTVRARYFWMGGDEFVERRPCAGLRVRWNRGENYVRASIPQSCYTAHAVPDRWVFFAHSSLGEQHFDAGPEFTVRKG